MPGPTRRTVLTGSAAAAAASASSAALAPPSSAAPAPDADELPEVPPEQQDLVASTFFTTAWVEESGTYVGPRSDGDLWPTCWADDDFLYTTNGDGRGFSDEPWKDIVVSRVAGTPETGLVGERIAEEDEVGPIWGDPEQYNRKPTGMVCVGGVLYLAMQDLKFGEGAFDDAPTASIVRSEDHGETWIPTEEPMFTDNRFTTIFFCDFGRDSELSRSALGADAGRYVYAYGLDWNWRASLSGTVPDPTSLYLARVLPRDLQRIEGWEFFTGSDRRGRPRWGAFVDKAPVLTDATRRLVDTRPGKDGNRTAISQGGVLYNAALDRYVFTSWTDPTFEFYESPTPWGPWKLFLSHNFGLVQWNRMDATDATPKNGGYGTTIPSKYVSRDGRTMWVQSNWWVGPVPTPQDNYNFNLRKLVVTPRRPARASNRADRRLNLARAGADVTAVQTCVQHGNRTYVHDGDRTKSEDSFDGTNKLLDWWGYTFSRPYRIDRIVYTSGEAAETGGWFEPFDGGLRVQVRRDGAWVDVQEVRTSPRYPYGPEATPFRTFTMRFAAVAADGVRIVGQPGGRDHFTSIAELEVYYDGR